MSDPFTGWLLYVELLLALVVSIFCGLDKILRKMDSMLGSLLSMRARLRKDRRETMASERPRKRAIKRHAGKRGHKSRHTST